MQGQPDPNVTFDWDGSTTDSRNCQPGTYTGTFTCPVLFGDVYEPGTEPVAEGPITLTLTKAQDGEFLEITGGQLQVTAGGFVDLQAKIVGTLDCSTDVLEGETVEGLYGLGDVNLLPTGTLEGELSGMLDRARATLRGTWNITWEAAGLPGTCNGAFTASWAP